MTSATRYASPLLDRLVSFSVAVSRATKTMPRDSTGLEVARQITRSSMSPAANYAEARESHTPRDYVHKMRIVLRELRETMVWIRIARGNGFKNADYAALQQECHELIAMVVTCVKKAQAHI